MIIEEGVSDDGIEDETYLVPTQSEERGQATIDELREVNLGDEGENKPAFISANLAEEEAQSPNGQKQEDLKNNKSGIGVVFVTPNNAIIPHSFALTEGCSNNEAEYEAVIAGLELALQIPIEELLVYGDSEFVIKQLRGEYIVKKASLAPYHERASQLLSQFRKINIFHVKRRINAQADSLASLAASLSLPDRETITVTVGERRVLQPLTEISGVLPVFATTTKEGDEDWREPFINYLQHGRLPEDKAKRAEVRRRATKFIMWKDALYKRSLDGMYMRCIANKHAHEVMTEVHSGKGDLVLMVRRPIVISRRTKGKLEPKWDGPYVIEKVYSNGAYLLITMDGERIIPPTNARFLKSWDIQL
ncbi:hypothetical protein RHSIM_Rhsim01G0139100 [Rhododendron simsii]|uniref:RNase H type-1 domain-containing protein n=1 Tax=Rhododendron simsii TaxID=118357 RepID=A0A834HPQ4_RHOSS|nr:hypothetical protein RHSIM_Rhsim01G0139100 [Rhododendron simsii]